jgi:hypothetical protein
MGNRADWETIEVELVIRRTDKPDVERFIISMYGPDSEAIDELRESFGDDFPGLEVEGDLEPRGDWQPRFPPVVDTDA